MTLRHEVFSLNYIITILSDLCLRYAKTFSVYTCDHLDFCFMFCASSQKAHIFFYLKTVFILFFLFDVYIMFILLQMIDVPQPSCGSPHMLVSLFITLIKFHMFSVDLIACYTASCDISHMLVFFMYYIVVYNSHVLYFLFNKRHSIMR